MVSKSPVAVLSIQTKTIVLKLSFENAFSVIIFCLYNVDTVLPNILLPSVSPEWYNMQQRLQINILMSFLCVFTPITVI